MASPILSYRPEIKIEILDNDVTVNLGDVGSCTVRKNLYQPAGEFQLVFPDLPVTACVGSGGECQGGTFRESLYGLVNPLDKIVIWVRRWRDGCPTVEPWVPILTGFVRSVGRDEQVGPDGRPQRQVVVAGQDCGGVFLMQMISALIAYQNDRLPNPKIPPALAWLRETGLTGRSQRVQDFIWDVATIPTQSIMTIAGFAFQRKFSVTKGTVLPHMAFSQDGTIWEMLYRYADGPWNELFVRENRNMYPDPAARCPGPVGDYHDRELVDPELVFRATPWMDYDGKFLPDVVEKDLTIWGIDMRHVVALRAHRDDAELVNHVWIHTPLLDSAAYTEKLKEISLVNADTRDKFGDRIQQESTRLFPFDLANAPISLLRAEQLAAEQRNTLWIKERLAWMVQAQNRIHDFERGSITMKGYPMMRVGDYFRLHRGDIVWHGYVTNIVHDFQPYKRYLTTMDYIRGSQIKVRRETQNPWDVERKTGN